MKKLLYTLLIGLVVVSCEKDMDGDTYSIAVPSQEIEASVDVDALAARLSRIASNSKDMDLKDSNVTAKDGDPNSILLISKLDVATNVYYEFLFSEDINFCDHDDFTLIYLVLNSASETEIRLSTHDGLLLGTITEDFSFLYGVTLSEGLKVDLNDLSATVVDAAGGTSFTF